MSGRDLYDQMRVQIHLALTVESLRKFAARIIAHASGGGTLDDDALAAIRAECIRDLKNADTTGMSIEQEAEAFGKVVESAEKVIDAAIREGRQPQ